MRHREFWSRSFARHARSWMTSSRILSCCGVMTSTKILRKTSSRRFAYLPTTLCTAAMGASRRPPERLGRTQRYDYPPAWASHAAKTLAQELLTEGFDVSYAYKPLHDELGTPSSNTVMFLDYDRKVLTIRWCPSRSTAMAARSSPSTVAWWAWMKPPRRSSSIRLHQCPGAV